MQSWRQTGQRWGHQRPETSSCNEEALHQVAAPGEIEHVTRLVWNVLGVIDANRAKARLEGRYRR